VDLQRQSSVRTPHVGHPTCGVVFSHMVET